MSFNFSFNKIASFLLDLLPLLYSLERKLREVKNKNETKGPNTMAKQHFQPIHEYTL